MKQIKQLAAIVKAYIRVDGLLHIETSALLVVFFGSFLPVAGAAILTMFVGIFKECYDAFVHDTNDGWQHDIYCDIAGMVLGVLLLLPWLELTAWA